jgi:ribonuclease HI
MLVTIFTDASYSEKYHLGAWACFIRSDNLTIKKSGKVQQEVDDSNTCELMAIVNALAILERHRKLSDCRLIIKTDSLTTIKMIRGGTDKQGFSTALRYAVTRLSRVESFRFTHVKAHVFKREDPEYGKPQYSINRWCDIHARKHLREAVRKAEDEILTKKIAKIKPKKTARARSVEERNRKHRHLVKGRGAGPYKRPRGPVRSQAS